MSASGEPLVVTGMGVLAAGVDNPAALYERAVAGESPAEWLEMPGSGAPVAGVRAPDPQFDGALARYARRTDRAAQLGLAAAAQAVDSAGLREGVDPRTVGVMVGTGRGPLGRTLDSAAELAAGRIVATASVDSTLSSMNGTIAQAFAFGAPSATVAATCASAASAIAIGALMLRAGEAQAMVVGGAEAPLIPLLISHLGAAGVLGSADDPRRTCRPFDVSRNGIVIGEGAAMLVLELESHARRRGAPVLGRLTGWATTVDGGGRTGITADGEGLVRAIGHALQMAGRPPTGIGYVNAHGTGTLLNDATEAGALRRIFGDGGPPVSSTKPITGHCLGATAALEAVIAIEALRGNCLPPTANLEQPDPACAVELIAGPPRPASARAVLSTSLGFWGAQAALVLEAA